jgi:hypothetical protein
MEVRRKDLPAGVVIEEDCRPQAQALESSRKGMESTFAAAGIQPIPFIGVNQSPVSKVKR